MDEYTVVTVIRDNVVDRLSVFTNTEEAELYFLEECASILSNFDEYTYYDKQELLSQGYETFGNGSICIAHP